MSEHTWHWVLHPNSFSISYSLWVSLKKLCRKTCFLKPKKIGNNLCVLHKAAGRSNWYLQKSSANVLKDIKAHWCVTMFTSPALSFRSARPCFICWFPHCPHPVMYPFWVSVFSYIKWGYLSSMCVCLVSWKTRRENVTVNQLNQRRLTLTSYAHFSHTVEMRQVMILFGKSPLLSPLPLLWHPGLL